MPRPVASQEQQSQQPNTSATASRPPEYTAVATTEFIVDNTLPEADDDEGVRETTSDTEPLVSPPPPYTP